MLEELKADQGVIEFGPFNIGLPTPLKIRAILDGEIIVSSEYEFGYSHRGLERLIENQNWSSIIPFSDRMEPESAVFSELVICQAVEQLCNIEVPDRAKYIRIILSELTRIACHLRYIQLVSGTLDCQSLVNYVSRDREKILDLIELVSGSRFSITYLCFGGVVVDVSEGFLERVNEASNLLKQRLKEYESLLSTNHFFKKRLENLAVISKKSVIRYGLSGPNARASGLDCDVRRMAPYSNYDHLNVRKDFSELNSRGDALSRYLMRIVEINDSMDLIEGAVGKIQSGAYYSDDVQSSFHIPAGEAYSRVESPRGILACHIISDGSMRPRRVHYITPSINSLTALPKTLSGIQIDDATLVLVGLDIKMSEVDR